MGPSRKRRWFTSLQTNLKKSGTPPPKKKETPGPTGPSPGSVIPPSFAPARPAPEVLLRRRLQVTHQALRRPRHRAAAAVGQMHLESPVAAGAEGLPWRPTWLAWRGRGGNWLKQGSLQISANSTARVGGRAYGSFQLTLKNSSQIVCLPPLIGPNPNSD